MTTPEFSLDAYQRAAVRTANPIPGVSDREYLMALALGCSGEAGEFADLVKKWVAHGHGLDRMKAAKELGDQLWYVASAAHRLGFTLAEVAHLNIAKLEARYPGPNGFTTEASLNRKPGDE